MSEPPKRLGIDTVPPPPGEEDLYSASTVVGRASDELLALVRSAEQSNTERSAGKGAATEDDKLTAMKEAAARAAKQAVANQIAREATKAAQTGAPPPPSGQPAARVVSVAPATSAPVAKAPSPSAAPAPRPLVMATPPPAATAVAKAADAATAPPRRTQGDTTKRPAMRTAADETRPATGLPPIVTIIVVFLVAALVLAALVR